MYKVKKLMELYITVISTEVKDGEAALTSGH